MSQIPHFEPWDYTSPAAYDAVGDRRDGAIYHYTPSIVLAVRVALATGRPLLVRGPSGSGKSSLAQHIARVLGWDFVDQVVTSRTQAQDLLWTVDHIRRLRDAHANQLGPIESYVQPGPLWRAFDPEGAGRQAARSTPREPASAPLGSGAGRAVVLLDEIDKADPDVPNNLLVALGSLQFFVSDLGLTVRGRRETAPLVVVTTNDERDLPGAFLRRCAELKLPVADRDRLVAIGALHFPGFPRETLAQVAELLVPEDLAGDRPETAAVSIAEYLDTIRACEELGVQPGTGLWDEVVRITVWKHGRSPLAR